MRKTFYFFPRLNETKKSLGLLEMFSKARALWQNGANPCCRFARGRPIGGPESVQGKATSSTEQRQGYSRTHSPLSWTSRPICFGRPGHDPVMTHAKTCSLDTCPLNVAIS